MTLTVSNARRTLSKRHMDTRLPVPHARPTPNLPQHPQTRAIVSATPDSFTNRITQAPRRIPAPAAGSYTDTTGEYGCNTCAVHHVTPIDNTHGTQRPTVLLAGCVRSTNTTPLGMGSGVASMYQRSAKPVPRIRAPLITIHLRPGISTSPPVPAMRDITGLLAAPASYAQQDLSKPSALTAIQRLTIASSVLPIHMK